MKVCGVVIWYNPTENMWKNVLSYLQLVDWCIIIDNSNTNNKKLIKSNSKRVSYIPNRDNLGIAKALNVGCEKAKERGFGWVLTMDQDSFFEAKEYKKYILQVEKIWQRNHSAISFSPNYNKKRESSFESVKSIITSGNVLNLSAWEKVGKFDEKLFVNEVDTIFCYTLLKNHYEIYQIYNAKMNHNVFDKYFHIKLFGKDYYIRRKDSPTAKYYITRNSLEKNKLFPKTTENPFFLVKLIIKVLFFECEKVKKIKMIYGGYRDYKRRKFGRID